MVFQVPSRQLKHARMPSPLDLLWGDLSQIFLAFHRKLSVVFLALKAPLLTTLTWQRRTPKTWHSCSLGK